MKLLMLGAVLMQLIGLVALLGSKATTLTGTSESCGRYAQFRRIGAISLIAIALAGINIYGFTEAYNRALLKELSSGASQGLDFNSFYELTYDKLDELTSENDKVQILKETMQELGITESDLVYLYENGMKQYVDGNGDWLLPSNVGVWFTQVSNTLELQMLKQYIMR